MDSSKERKHCSSHDSQCVGGCVRVIDIVIVSSHVAV